MKNGGSLGKGSPWEVPVGNVISGMDVVHSFYSGYGDIDAFNPKGMSQQKIRNSGEAYIEEDFPLISRFKGCEITDIDGSSTRAALPSKRKMEEVIPPIAAAGGDAAAVANSTVSWDRCFAAILMVMSGFSSLILIIRLANGGTKKSKRYNR